MYDLFGCLKTTDAGLELSRFTLRQKFTSPQTTVDL
jgi:hypothetical protein